MTQYFSEDGKVHPATLISAGPVTVTQVKTPEGKDGYRAVQVGFGTQKEHRVAKAQRSYATGPFRYLREFRIQSEASVGDVVDVSAFAPGDTLSITSTSKGKGFQGVVKRHGFHGGPRTHGQKHSEREAGSIGATGPQRVLKGTRMPGRMGSDTVTVKNITVLAVDPKTNTLLVKGAVPGRKGSLLRIVG